MKRKAKITFLIKTNRRSKYLLRKLLETRLDVILVRAKFAYCLINAQEVIDDGIIYVNNIQVKNVFYRLKPGDLISVDPDFHIVIGFHIRVSPKLPLPPEYLIVNYGTMEILYCKNTVENSALLPSTFSNLQETCEN